MEYFLDNIWMILYLTTASLWAFYASFKNVKYYKLTYFNKWQILVMLLVYFIICPISIAVALYNELIDYQ
jgi:hypothetical protein